MLLKVRFHGRGGHGVKTAARIVGTAAFLARYQAQDSPMYGAERRGAAVTASVRISDHLILERGPITVPNLIVLADETLLRDASAGVLRGQEGASAIFINMQSDVPPPTEFGIQRPVISYDLSALTRQVFGHASALSAGLAAAAARLTGLISWESLRQATQEELEGLELTGDEIEKNVGIAEQVFEALSPARLLPESPAEPESLVTATYQRPLLGSPSILHGGNAALRQTGTWRVERPVVDRDTCTRCGLCYVMCPDGAIQMDVHGYPIVDYDHCKGCMICQRLCPLHAIGREWEMQAW